jgi:hypothetical protein
MHYTCGDSFDTQAREGSERELAQGLRGEMGGELRESESVNTLAAGGKRVDGELMCAGSGRRDHQYFRVLRFSGQEGGGVMEERGVRAGVDERTRGHRQL